MNLYEPLARAICRAIPELAEDDLVFAPAPKPEMGDVALRLFEAAKKLQCPPPQLAQRIADEADFGDMVTTVRAAGPYLNLHLNRSLFGRRLVSEVLARGAAFGSNGSGGGRRALVEHTSINPNASPHVGRARNAMIGDSIVRLLRFEGYDVTVHYYVNDMGRQIALLVLAIEEKVGDLSQGAPSAMAFDEVLQIYVDANSRAEQDPDFAARGYELLARMEEGDEATHQKFHAVTRLCLNGQILVLARLGINYDEFDRESDFLKDPRLDAIVEKLREQDAVFTDEEGRLTVDLAKLGYEYEADRYKALRRSNGSSMYFYRDLAYTIHKMSQGADLNLIVLGEDHRSYAVGQEIVLRAAGHEAPEPVYYSYITLKDGKMSTRRGQVVLLSEFLDEATQRSLAKVREQRTELDDTGQRRIADKVAVGAVRFTILRVNPNKNVIFEWEPSLSFTGDTGPYVQYCTARIASILRRFGDVPRSVADDFELDADAEWGLCRKLADFPAVVLGAVEQRNPAPVAIYALEAAHAFTTFYHECPVLDAESDARRTARAQLCAATRQTLKNALGLIGIEALERM